MEQVTFLRGAAQLLTLRGPNTARRGSALQDLGIIEDGSILLRDGLILEVGPTRRIENLKEAKNALEIPVKDKIILPGFADAGLNLGLRQPNKRQKFKPASALLEESLSILRSCLHHGTVVAEIRTRACKCDSTALTSALRTLTRIGQNPVPVLRTWLVDLPTEINPSVIDSLHQTFALLSRRKLADFIQFNAHSTLTNGHEAVVDSARAAKFGLKFQWDGQCSGESLAVLARANPRSISLPLHVHSHFCQPLANLPSTLVFTPGDEITSPVNGGGSIRNLIDAGAAVALASGYDSAQTTSVSMQMAIALATIRMRLTTEEAISAATINAAWALGVSHRNGSLQVNKRADVLVMNVPDYRELARNYGVNHVGMVIRDGSIVFNRMRLKAGARG